MSEGGGGKQSEMGGGSTYVNVTAGWRCFFFVFLWGVFVHPRQSSGPVPLFLFYSDNIHTYAPHTFFFSITYSGGRREGRGAACLDLCSV